MRRKYYSRRSSLEEEKNLKKAITFIVLSVLSLLAIVFIALPLIARLVGFITDLKNKDTPISITDNTPPAPPRIENLPEATNKISLEITGVTEEGVEVYIFINNDKNEVVANSFGEFNLSVNLDKGENVIYAIAKDQAGNESVESEYYVVVYDNEPPEINVDSPSDGESFYGSKQKEIEIKGSTDPDSTLTINDRFVTLDDEGYFVFKISLNEGENTLNLKAIDKAENQTEKSIKVNFTP